MIVLTPLSYCVLLPILHLPRFRLYMIPLIIQDHLFLDSFGIRSDMDRLLKIGSFTIFLAFLLVLLIIELR